MLKIRHLKGGKVRRPEVAGAKMYEEQEEQKYIMNLRNATIQRDMTKFAMKLLNIGIGCCEKHIVLDIGCGCGVSSFVVESAGNFVVGVDISKNLLSHARLQNTLNDFVITDITKGIMFKPGSFDFAVSISVFQWFMDEYSLLRIFSTLKVVLALQGKAVLQFYPRNYHDLDLTLRCAEKYFKGCVICDYPSENRGRKLFIYLLNSSSDENERHVLTLCT